MPVRSGRGRGGCRRAAAGGGSARRCGAGRSGRAASGARSSRWSIRPRPWRRPRRRCGRSGRARGSRRGRGPSRSGPWHGRRAGRRAWTGSEVSPMSRRERVDLVELVAAGGEEVDLVCGDERPARQRVVLQEGRRRRGSERARRGGGSRCRGSRQPAEAEVARPGRKDLHDGALGGGDADEVKVGCVAGGVGSGRLPEGARAAISAAERGR